MRFFDIVKIFSVVAAVIAVSLMAKKHLDWPLAGTATMILAGCAIMGLDTWKKRHESDLVTLKERDEADLEKSAKQYEFDLIIRLLASIYKYRDAINELIKPTIDDPTLLSEKEEGFGKRLDFLRERVRKTKSVRQEFYDDVLKSEALWGEDLRLMVKEMKELEEIARTIEVKKLIVTHPKADHSTKEDIEQDIKNLESDGAIEKRFDDLFKKAEKYLKEKKQSHR